MSQVVIENPIINSPFDEPTCHFRFNDEGITDEIVDGRRSSSYFVPIARPKSFLACAFVERACRRGFTGCYVRAISSRSRPWRRAR